MMFKMKTAMKTRITLITLAIAALAVSCMKESNPEVTPAANKITVRVTIPEDTKVSMTEASDHKSMGLAWESTDKISINGEEFTIDSGFTAHEAEFTGTAPSSSSPYTIIYPGKYTDAAAFNARSYAGQEQTENKSTAHLEYNAMLSGVSEYEAPKFDPDWAAAKGGSLVQNAVVQMRLQLPDGASNPTSVSLVATNDIFPTTNAGTPLTNEMTLSLKNVTLPTNRILEAYMMVSAAGVTIADGEVLTVAVVTPDATYVRELTLSAQTWTGGGQYTLQLKNFNVHNFDINNVADLEMFRDGVNSGDILWQTVHANLMADLDCSGIISWTPIGNGTFTGSNYSGNAFKGVFDGGGHTLRNFSLVGTTPADQGVFGFFGILVNATVKDLTFGAESSDTGKFTVSMTGGTGDAGVVAGAAIGSTLENITNYLPMTCNGSDTNSKRATCAMVGYVYGNKTFGMSTISGLVNRGTMTHHWGSNTTVGANGVHGAGIVGYVNGSGTSTLRNHILNCKNYGDMTSEIGRTAGIAGAIYAYTIIEGCENLGHQENSCDNGRLGGITSIVQGMYSEMKDCINRGDIIASGSTNTQLGGLACMLSKGSADTEDGFVKVSGGGNYGKIIGDRVNNYHGTLIGNFSSFASVNDVTAGGAYGTYNGGDYQYTVLTAENYMSYIGTRAAANESKITNIHFDAWDGYPAANETLISSAAELVAFAAEVNAGHFAATDVAKLTADIDCSSITDWTPIGNGSMSSWSATALTFTDPEKLFVGTFDGQNHSIKNLAMNFSSSGSYDAYGFFGGIGDGAVVKNLSFDSSCSMTVSASYGSAFGMLAGIVTGAAIDNVKNYAPITGGGTSSLGNNNAAGRTMVGGIIGEVHPGSVQANISNLHNYADIGSSGTIFSRGNNAGNGANGFEVGGIAGFSTTSTTSLLANFSSCVNDGNIYTDAGRSSGIVAGCNRYTKLLDCTNNGDVVSSVSGTFRLGNITCIAGEGSILDGCVNTGDLTALNCVSVAGVVCLVNHESVQIKSCASLGATILGKSVNISGNQTYNGVLFGYCNNAATFNDCSVSGKIGTSTSSEDQVTLTAENYFQYVGQIGANATNINATCITFASE